MKKLYKTTLYLSALTISTSLLSGCTNTSKTENNSNAVVQTDSLIDYVAQRLSIYEKVKLTTNLNQLSVNDRKILPLLIQAAEIMDDLYWKQAYPQRDSLLATIKDEKTREFVNINYGPWDRLNNEKPFVAGVGAKPEGASFYPYGITKAEIEKSDLADKFGAYSVIQKDTAGKLTTVPYHVLFAAELQKASSLLKQAALIAEDAGLKKYLNLRADALVTDNFEVAHGLGIKKTITGKGFVREALKEQYSWLEEGKADVLGLYMVTGLLKKGELTGDIKDYYTTFMAGILRSVRFGVSEAHGKANMQCFNYFQEKGAFERTSKGTYKVNFEKFATAMNELSAFIITLQGNGDKVAVEKAQKEKAVISAELQKDLDRLTRKNIPVDVVFEQGVDVLGVK
ncbi:MAG: Zn-dependent hydrolase [Pedobacter sp.]|nr:MAG: Zn-dependent hydrolase [Pedobacter sp.]